MKKIIIVAGFVLSWAVTKSQNEVDALRYSQIGVGGTARSSGMAGAFGALGADFSTLSTNPGGIGLYTKSEFIFTPGLYTGNSVSNYNGTQENSMNINLAMSNVGIVFAREASESAKSRGWKNFQFGFGMNKQNIFNSTTNIQGSSTFQNSITNQWLNQAYGLTPGQLTQEAQLAYDVYLLNPNSSGKFDNNSLNVMPSSNQPMQQSQTITTSGAMNELLFSFGGNYKDRLYLGMTVGMPIINYTEHSTYNEAYNGTDSTVAFQSLALGQDLHTTATGLNLKIGAIYRVTDWLRIGGAFHTPTWFFNMHDDYNSSLTATIDTTPNHPSTNNSSLYGSFDYHLLTPMRAIGSVGFIIGKIGVIDIDYEYLDYTKALLNSSNYTFSTENQNIQNLYRPQQNIRIGGELNLAPFAIRAGYGLYGSPYKTGTNDQLTSYTLGFGIRGKHCFFDIAYILTQSQTTNPLYDYYVNSVVNPVNVKTTNNNYIATFGVKF